MRCHAPLGEQADSLAAEIERVAPRIDHGGRADRSPIHARGVVCAACHLRDQRTYGPPRRDGSAPKKVDPSLPHGGWTASAAFQDARFCAGCHQFEAGGYALNGKLLQDTYREWQASRYAREGVTCQACHMPDRRHLWRGIHDAEMVRRSADVAADPVTLAGGKVRARLRVANVGAGHAFPTYVTPSVVIRGVQRDAAGRPLAGTAREFVIARKVSPDLERELFDTRIPEGAASAFDYRMALHPRATTLAWSVEVRPDAFYLDFYEARLRAGPSGRAHALIARARDLAARSAYVLYATRLALR